MNEKNNRNTPRWIFPIIVLLIGLVLGAGCTFALQESGIFKTTLQSKQSQQQMQKKVPTDQMLYDSAVKDAMFADKDEIMPLVSLTKKDKRVTWNDTGDRVLLLTWHNYPDSYPVGKDVSLAWGKVWTFTGTELQTKYNNEKNQVTDWDHRLKQIIGFPPDSKHSTITGIWVRPQDVLRPAYQSDPTKDSMDTKFGKNVDPKYKKWFDGNIIWSYFDSAYPWTRLGYTYDWGSNGKEYGVSEFLVNEKAQVHVAFTEDTNTFIQELAKGKVH